MAPKKKITIIESKEELLFRSTQSESIRRMIETPLTCTRCDAIIRLNEFSNILNVHPILKVVICEACKIFHDLQHRGGNTCTWCFSKLNLHRCCSCSLKFCEICIHKHFRFVRTTVREIKDGKWHCCVCVPKPIWKQRAICAAIIEDSKSYCMLENNNTSPAVITSDVTPDFPSDSSIDFDESSNEHSRTTTVVSEIRYQMSPIDCRVNKEVVDSVKISNKMENKTCVVCLDNPPLVALYPCGHKCMCNDCAHQLFVQDRRCPICRQTFYYYIRIYD